MNINHPGVLMKIEPNASPIRISGDGRMVVLTGRGLAMSAASVTRPRSTLYINDAAGLTRASDVGKIIFIHVNQT